MNTGEKVAWQYDEFQQVGVDYCDIAEVEEYDARHSDFRDMDAEALGILNAIEVKDTDVLIDFGSGTGTFAIHAATYCQMIHAVDVSQAMLEYAGARASQHGIANIEFHLAGFLTYEHVGRPVDAIVTSFAFHHLPDFWKGIALKHMASLLRTGGLLYMHDVIIQESMAMDNIAALIQALERKGGAVMKEDVEKHFREEFSTYDWILEGLFSRSGFSVRSKKNEDGVIGTYICIKK